MGFATTAAMREMHPSDRCSWESDLKMSNEKNFKFKRFKAGSMSFLLLAVLLLSVFFMAVEAEHECTGEDCHICEVLEQCFNTVKRLGENVAVTVTFAVSVIFAAVLLLPSTRETVGSTLVSRKVRMND